MSEESPRIGQLLVQSGVLSESVLADVLERQKRDRRRLGDLLPERNLVEPRRLAQILSYQLSCPWLSLSNVDLGRELIQLVPRDLAIEHTVVPVHLRQKNGTTYLYVAMHDPTDAAALAQLSDAAKMPCLPMVAITYEIRQALHRYYGAPLPSLTTAPPEVRSASIVPGAPRTAAKPPPPPIPKRSAAPAPPEVATVRFPVVLVLNAPARFLHQCTAAARSCGATTAEGTIINAAERVKELRPAAIVVTDDIYSFDRAGLNRLAIESDALLVVWSEDVEASQLKPLIEGACRRTRR